MTKLTFSFKKPLTALSKKILPSGHKSKLYDVLMNEGNDSGDFDLKSLLDEASKEFGEDDCDDGMLRMEDPTEPETEFEDDNDDTIVVHEVPSSHKLHMPNNASFAPICINTNDPGKRTVWIRSPESQHEHLEFLCPAAPRPAPRPHFRRDLLHRMPKLPQL